MTPRQAGLRGVPLHLQKDAVGIQMVLVDPLRPGPVDMLMGPSGRAVLDATGCTLLICDRQWWL
ncbi:hypothetical protein [Mycobacterium sp.]|uniref:hypothetical protein n=1 Tax=Mycobacterium sp. TaxID=1785 RepID=UPI003D6BA53D